VNETHAVGGIVWSIYTRVQQAVKKQRQLTGDLGQKVAAHRDSSVALAADDEAAGTGADLVGRLCTVGVKVGEEHFRQHPQVFWHRERAGVGGLGGIRFCVVDDAAREHRELPVGLDPGV